MKSLTIEEYSAATNKQRKESIAVIAAGLVREFLESGYEACEVTDEDINRSKGYLTTGNDSYVKTGNRSYSKINYNRASYMVTKLREQAVALKVDDMIEVRMSHGHVYMARKEML